MVDEILLCASLDHEFRAGWVRELARVIKDLIAVVALALVSRVRPGLDQHARQLGIARDAGRAVERHLEPLVVDE